MHAVWQNLGGKPFQHAFAALVQQDAGALEPANGRGRRVVYTARPIRAIIGAAGCGQGDLDAAQPGEQGRDHAAPCTDRGKTRADKIAKAERTDSHGGGFEPQAVLLVIREVLGGKQLPGVLRQAFFVHQEGLCQVAGIIGGGVQVALIVQQGALWQPGQRAVCADQAQKTRGLGRHAVVLAKAEGVFKKHSLSGG